MSRRPIEIGILAVSQFAEYRFREAEGAELLASIVDNHISIANTVSRVKGTVVLVLSTKLATLHTQPPCVTKDSFLVHFLAFDDARADCSQWIVASYEPKPLLREFSLIASTEYTSNKRARGLPSQQ